MAPRGSRKRSRSEALTPTAAVACFAGAQDLAANGKTTEALRALEELVESAGPPKPPATSSPTAPRSFDPPLAVVLSAAHNLLGELRLDRAMAACSQRSLTGPDADSSGHHFRTALQWWPENASALVSLAHLHRDQGRLPQALDLYTRAAALPLGAPGDSGWTEAWRDAPRRAAQPYATLMQATLLSLTGRHAAATAPLRRLRMTRRLAPAVWDRLTQPDPPAAVSPTCPVRFYHDALPPAMLGALRDAFQPGAAYWRQTGYDGRSYFSFWYQVGEPPRHLVERLIQDLLPLTGRTDVVGAEWWVHTRLAGRDLGHQLHFDTEEETVRRTGEVRHPALSSVCYLVGEGGGPTLVLDQRLEGPEASRGWLARPRSGGVLLFPGDRLHGALPSAPIPGTEGQPATQRLTLMIGFWTQDVAALAPRKPLGPCGPLPRVTRRVDWPKALTSPDPPIGPAATPVAVPVEEVAPVWAAVTGPFPPGPAPPPSPNIDQRFFVRAPGDFRRWLLEEAAKPKRRR